MGLRGPKKAWICPSHTLKLSIISRIAFWYSYLFENSNISKPARGRDIPKVQNRINRHGSLENQLQYNRKKTHKNSSNSKNNDNDNHSNNNDNDNLNDNNDNHNDNDDNDNKNSNSK